MRVNRRASLLGGLLTAAALIVGAPVGQALAQDVPGVTEDTIKIGILGSLTGPSAIWGTGQLAGATMAFDEVNAAGGIHGRKIEFVSVDDETSPPKGIAGFKKLVGEEKVFAVMGPASSAVGVAMVPVMAASDVPVFISIFSTPSVTEPMVKNVFRTGPINDRMQGEAIGDYVVDELGGKKIALIWQAGEYGQRGADGVKTSLERHSMEPIAEEVFQITDTDFSAQLLKIRETEPDVLVVYGYGAPSATIMRQARQFGMDAKLIGSNATSGRNYAKTVGDTAAGIQHVITAAALPEGDEPKMAAFRASYEKRYPDLARQGRPDLADVLGYGGALVFIEGLERAGKDLTRETFIAALESINNYETGIIMATTFSATDHEGNKAARIVEIQPDLSRKLLPVTIRAKN